jgi:hypothetical protein
VGYLAEEARTQPGAYITDGTGLYQVVELVQPRSFHQMRDIAVELEDVKTLERRQIPVAEVIEKYQLVRAAPPLTLL